MRRQIKAEIKAYGRLFLSFIMLLQILLGPLAQASENASKGPHSAHADANANKPSSLTYDLLSSMRNTAKYDAEIVGPYSSDVKDQYKNLVGFPISSANKEFSKSNVLWSQGMQLGFTVEEKGQFKSQNPLYSYDQKSESDFIRSVYKAFNDMQIDQVIQGQIKAANNKYVDYDKSGKAIDYLKGKAATVKEATMRFPKDSALFFVAIGLVMYNQLYFHYEGNPIAMEMHVASLSDPIANLAFYSFIVANSLSNEAFSRTGYAKLDRQKRIKAFKVLNYKSLFWGMLASNIVADVGHTIKACTQKISGLEMSSDQDNLITVCGEAMRMWTAPKVVNRYTPLIASLMISQKLSEVLMQGTSAAKNIAKNIVGTVATSLAPKAPQMGTIFQGLSFALRAGPAGKIYIFGVSTLTMVVTFAVFVQIDHVVNPIINTIYNVIAYPFRRFDNALNLNMCSKFFKNNYQVHAAFNKKDDFENTCEEEFIHSVLDWRDFSNEWRNAMNSKFELGYMMWSDMITTLFNQYASAETYYLTFLQELEGDIASRADGNIPNSTDRNHFSRVHYLNGVLVKPSYFTKDDKRKISELNAEEKTKLKQDVNDHRLIQPGVLDYGMLDDDAKPLNNGRIGLVLEAVEQSGLFPDEAILKKSRYAEYSLRQVGYCKNHYNQCGIKPYKSVENQYQMTVSDLLKEIRKDLLSANLYNKGLGLYKLNTLIKSLDSRDPLALRLVEFRNYLGSPEPIFSATSSFPYVYGQASSNKDSLDNSKYAYPSKYVGGSYIKDKIFDNAAYYFTHEMICGPAKGQVQHTFGFKANFVPPNILKEGLDKNSEEYLIFCKSQLADEQSDATSKPRALYGKGVRKTVTSAEGSNTNYRYSFNKSFDLFGLGKATGPIGIILQSYAPEMLKQIPNENMEDESAPETVMFFEKWWYENSFKPFERFLDQQDAEYQKLYSYLQENLNNNVELKKYDLVDIFQYPFKLIGKNWTDAGFSVIDSLQFELDLYLKIVESIARDQDSKDQLLAARKRYDRVFGYLFRLDSFMSFKVQVESEKKSEEQKELDKKNEEKAEKKRPSEMMALLDMNKMGLMLSFKNNEGKMGISPKDEKTFLALEKGLESVDANLKKYIMAKTLIEFDSKEKAKQLTETQKVLEGVRQQQKSGSTGRSL